MQRRTLMTAAVTTLALGLTATASFAADYPRRPINIVVPYGAGGGVDTYARALAATAAEGIVEVPIVIKNQGGSGGLNGAQAVSKARPDGYTVMLTSGGSFLLSTMTRDTDIDALETFDFVGQVGNLRTSLMVPTASPFQSVQDVIDAAKAAPGTLRWAHSGRGGFHFVGGLGSSPRTASRRRMCRSRAAVRLAQPWWAVRPTSPFLVFSSSPGSKSRSGRLPSMPAIATLS